MAEGLQMKIVSPTGLLFEGEVQHVAFPGTLGEFAVFPQHAPLISSLTKGEITYVIEEGELKTCAVSSGFVQVQDDKITVCVEE